MTRLIGINARLHGGKDTAYEILCDMGEEQGLNVVRAGFADKMKLSGVRALGFDPETIEEALAIANDIKENYNVVLIPRTGWRRWFRRFWSWITGREYWQRYGTEAHRDVFADTFWVDVLLPPLVHDAFDRWEGLGPKRLGELFPGADVVVITDVRFQNEADRVQSYGGEVWFVDADERLGPLPEDAHISERGVQHPDLVVSNNGTLEEFDAAVREAFLAKEKSGWLS